MARTSLITISADILTEVLVKLGMNPETATKAYFELAMSENKIKPKRKRPARPKLSTVMNPGSKFFDDTPDRTKQLSLLFYKHQHSHKRYRHERVTDENRQWVLLVQIKQAMVRNLGGMKGFIGLASSIFREAERIAKTRGKNNIYLTSIVSNLEEIIDSAIDSREAVITKKEEKTFKAYRSRRTAVSGRKIKDLIPGSPEHVMITEIVGILKEYRVTASTFFTIQFAAFKIYDSFPTLKNLITTAATDRLEIGITKAKSQPQEKLSTKEKEYWKRVKDNSSK